MQRWVQKFAEMRASVDAGSFSRPTHTTAYRFCVSLVKDARVRLTSMAMETDRRTCLSMKGLIFHNGRFLVMRRCNGEDSHWELPGGANGIRRAAGR